MNEKLQEHVFSTYITLRYGVVLIAALLPAVVYGVGRAFGIALQDSISAYYWASAAGGTPSREPSRRFVRRRTPCRAARWSHSSTLR